MGSVARRGMLAAGGALAAVAARDLAQRRHAILRNFPVLGHGTWYAYRAIADRPPA